MKIIVLLLLLCSCQRQVESPSLTAINIIDRNGMSETVNTPDRLKQYQEADFTQSQSYEKVLRVFKRDSKGNISAIVTSYHPNGQIKQYLEIVNNRAWGVYREWHPTGCQKIEAVVHGGLPDLTQAAQKSWLFDGRGDVWDEAGHLIAVMHYNNGELEGESIHYHPNGNIWKRDLYRNNQHHGVSQIYLIDGQLLQTTEWFEDQKHGNSQKFWTHDRIATDETYIRGSLVEGKYYDKWGELISSIEQGTGWRATFGKESLAELQEYSDGKQRGIVKVFGKDGSLVRIYRMENEMKNGEEQEYHPGTKTAKMLISWVDNKVHGPVKTWYENGKPESLRHMSDNKKNGVLTAWYRDGSVMMIEEYEQDKLQKGEYFRKGDRIPLTQITKGQGTAIIFDAEGNIVKKISYQDGKPID